MPGLLGSVSEKSWLRLWGPERYLGMENETKPTPKFQPGDRTHYLNYRGVYIIESILYTKDGIEYVTHTASNKKLKRQIREKYLVPERTPV